MADIDRNITLAAAVLFLSTGLMGRAQSAEWRVSPSLGITQRYSDNVNAAPQGAERGDFISGINSGVALSGQGRRASIQANYNAQRYFFLQDEREDLTTHFLSSNLQAEIMRDFLFIDADAAMAPTLINNTGLITNQNYLGISENRADVINYGFTPRIQHRLGSWATLTASTSLRDTTASRQGNDNGSNLAGSGNSSNYNVRAASGRRFSRVDWAVNFAERTFTADRSQEESTFRDTRLELGYRLSRKLRLNGSLGVEANEFVGNRLNGDNFSAWSVGANYNPTPRTNLSGSFGRRAFGDTRNFEFSHRFRRAVINGSYQEDYRTTAEILQDQQIYRVLDQFGQPLPEFLNPAEMVDPQLPLNNLSLTDDVFVSRNLRVGIGYSHKLDSFNVDVFRLEQESARTQGVESALGTTFTWTRQLSVRSTASLSVTRQDRSGDFRSDSVQALFLSPRLIYQLGQHVNVSVAYSYAENSSDAGQFDFQENSATATLSYAF